MANFLTRIFGSRNQRLLRQYSKVVDKINALEEGIKALDDAALRAKTDEFRQRYADGESLEALLPETFAVAREAGVRGLENCIKKIMRKAIKEIVKDPQKTMRVSKDVLTELLGKKVFLSIRSV